MKFLEAFKAKDIPFVSTPIGIVTANGSRFNTTKDILERYARPILVEFSLQKMINDAEVWLRSSAALATVGSILALYLGLNWWAVIIFAVIFVIFWETQKSAFISPKATQILSIVTNDGLVFIVSAILLSLMGMHQLYIPLATGILLFFVMRIQLIQKLVGWLYTKSVKESLNDRVLRMMTLKYAMHLGVIHPDVQAIEASVQALHSKLANVGKGKDKEPKKGNKSNKKS